MSEVITPSTPEALAAAIDSYPRVLALGSGSKPRLTRAPADVVRISTARLSGIIEYDPSEYTFSALGGTPVRDIVAALAEQGQYLPFDPMLLDAGSTVGGMVASGLSGPGRWRYGGLRDFILAVRLADGVGRLMRLGAKVVKNAAGFDVPKFMVGTAGRYGIIAEATFKVFPQPSERRTLRLDAPDPAEQARLLMAAANTRWELEALEAPVGESSVYVRLAGPGPAVRALSREVLQRFSGRALDDGETVDLWTRVREFTWAPASWPLAKVVLTPSQVPAFSAWLAGQPGARGWIGAGGNVGYAAAPAGFPTGIPWPGMVLRGEGPAWLGPRNEAAIKQAVSRVFDPITRFPSLDE
jgi:glycolate oxidase FAD binding subunit